MENKQDLASQVPQWIETWSKYVLTQYSTASHMHEDAYAQALELVKEILSATTQGDSCIAKQGKNTAILATLIANDQVAQTEVAPFVQDDEFVYLYRYWQLEQRLATQVLRLKQQAVQQVDVSAYDDLLSDEHQKKALVSAAKNAFNIITGGPGTGKTYTLARIIAVLHQAIPDIRIAMAAPTGKAAQRMGEALQNSLSDPKLHSFGLDQNLFNPMTLHRLLGLGNQHVPRFNLRQPLPYDVIVVDEASMLDLNLATILFEAVPEHCRLILLGDANQLASVDVGSVLADLQHVELLKENRVNLLTTRRFSDDALIGKMARFIQQQKHQQLNEEQILQDFENEVVQATEIQNIVLQNDVQDVIQLEYLPEKITSAELESYNQKLSFGFQPYFETLKNYLSKDENSDEDIEEVVKAFDLYRILTAVRHGTLGLEQLNREMEKALFASLPTLSRQGDWYVGRPVMMTYNDYQLGLSNGDIGICFRHRQQADQFEVYFPSLNKWLPATRLPKSMQTAFVLTIHKSQGSEFTHTAVVLDAAATRLLSQELIYTAITRAKKVVSLLVDQQAFVQSLMISTRRMSGLVSKIK
ncbi:exodeoxyribonuclease V subunit alpha [Acinetobacter sp. WCHAc060033]|uniref:exodeoxyribonuclease V subunit alpha n=1 Tax=Acinetobacter sp. WCHAc060033 TaxID=2518624 RepID=UPI001BC88702|nr:exodeoxyribonuclease V subunit alpha [Acinetobacter sp. WCHAc060033]